MGIGYQELLIILLIVLVLFGAKKIPELMKGLGSGIKSFKKEMAKDDDDTTVASNQNTQNIEQNKPQNTQSQANTQQPQQQNTPNQEHKA